MVRRTRDSGLAPISAAADPFGLAIDGEVEDYVFQINASETASFMSSTATIDLLPAPVMGHDSADAVIPPGEFRGPRGSTVSFSNGFDSATLSELRLVPDIESIVVSDIGPDQVTDLNVTVLGVLEDNGNVDRFELRGTAQISAAGKAGQTSGTFDTSVTALDVTGLLPDGTIWSFAIQPEPPRAVRSRSLVMRPTVLIFRDPCRSIRSSRLVTSPYQPKLPCYWI